jgi:hypothetical protein
MAERSERATGTANTIYDLASVLYHTLQAGASYDRYIRDAEEAGDQELVEFYRLLRDEDSRRADYAQELIALRTPAGAERAETSAAPPSREEEGAPPREREEDRGLVDEVRDRLLGPREERRSFDAEDVVEASRAPVACIEHRNQEASGLAGSLGWYGGKVASNGEVRCHTS